MNNTGSGFFLTLYFLPEGCHISYDFVKLILQILQGCGKIYHLRENF
jgi:hypothetical protein